MNSLTNQDNPVKPGQPQPQPPGKEEEKGRHGEGGGQPKPEIPEEVPKREIDRKPSDPKAVPDGPEQGPKRQIPDKGENEENNDVEEQDPDLLVEDDRDTGNKNPESLVDSRDRFPFPDKDTPYKKNKNGN